MVDIRLKMVSDKSTVSPLLFSIMINDIFKAVEDHVNVALFVGDGALWILMVHYGREGETQNML